MSIQRLFTLILLCLTVSVSSLSAETNTLFKAFLHPPDNTRIMMRWWWFGSAVETPELERELRAMKSAGIGGVEIQPVYPLALDDPKSGFLNLPYLSDAYLNALQFAAHATQQLGMRIDVTLGSGWPFGGPGTSIEHAAGRLRIDRVLCPEGATSIPLPAIEQGEQLIAAFAANEDNSFKQMTDVSNGRLQLGPHPPHTVLFFTSSRTGQQVKRPAVGAEGFVLDHYERAAIQQHLSTVGDRLLRAFGNHPPYAVFSDSLEVFGTDWTPNFLREFKARRGYHLVPYLPALVENIGPATAAIRHDWGKTLTEIAEQNYLTPIREWAHAHHTLFRSQTYGEPPVILSSNSFVDLPEGEHGPEWRGFSAARWAASASHLYGRPVTSSETWTWLHSPAFRATPLDMKAEADLHFLQGINQLIGHGWPYSPASAGEPGWNLYAAAAFNEHDPWFPVMPEIALYLQRISFLMRQGQPANDIAIYLPTDDAWAAFTPGKVSVDQSMNTLLGPNLIPQILNAGYNFDFIDDRTIEDASTAHKMLILPAVERIPLTTLRKFESFLKKGGIVIATRRIPSLAPGFLEAKSDSAAIDNLAKQLFAGTESNAHFIADEQTLAAELPKLLTPDFAVENTVASAIGFVHRKLPAADIYFVANTSNQPFEAGARIRTSHAHAEQWDPVTGAAQTIPLQSHNGSETLPLKLAPYESKVLVFSNDNGRTSPVDMTDKESIDLTRDWKLTFGATQTSTNFEQLHSWTDSFASRFYSGQVVYEKTISLPVSFTSSATQAVLNFGPGIPVAPTHKPGPGMRALLESPVREAAIVFVNGQRAGAVWKPPYEVNITKLVHPGANTLRIEVGNTAMNEMAGRALPSYKLLNLRYGQRFVPQDTQDIQPLPSGIMGPLRLVARTRVQ